MEKAIEGGQCERERVFHPSEKSRRFVSNSPTARSRKSSAALQWQQLCASKSSRFRAPVPVPVPVPFPVGLAAPPCTTGSAGSSGAGGWGVRGALGGSEGRGRRAWAERQPSPPANVSRGPGTSRAALGARTAPPPPSRGKGKCGARRGLGSFAQGHAAIRQPQTPGRGASHLLLLSQLGRHLLLPGRGRTSRPGSEGGGVGGGSGGRFSSLAASRAAGVASSPPRRDSRGRPVRPGALRLAGRGRGAEPGGPVSQKSPGYCRAHWSPGQRAAFPGAGKLGFGDSGLLWLTRYYKLLDLTCLCTPHFHFMSPCSCASNR